MNQFQQTFLQKTLQANQKRERSTRVKLAEETGMFFLTFDAWRSAIRIPGQGDEVSRFLIDELVRNGLLLCSTARQPAPGGTERIDFYHVTALGRQELAALKAEEQVAV